MSTLTKVRGVQDVRVAEFTFNYSDDMKDINGASANFSAVAAPVFDIVGLPPNSVVVGGEIIVETAYVGPTVATIALGDSGSATRYAAATSMLATGRTALTLTGYRNTGALALRATFSITVAPASAGKVTVRVQYVDGRVENVGAHA